MNEKPVHIYVATCSINKKVYVGITTDLGKRKFQHKRNADSGVNTVFSNAIRKYGWDCFKWEILETCSSRDLAAEREIVWIKRLNSKLPDGYNMTDGGEGVPGKKSPCSEETRKKISDSNLGRVFTDDHKEKLSQARRGMRTSQETRDRMKAAQKARRLREAV